VARPETAPRKNQTPVVLTIGVVVYALQESTSRFLTVACNFALLKKCMGACKFHSIRYAMIPSDKIHGVLTGELEWVIVRARSGNHFDVIYSANRTKRVFNESDIPRLLMGSSESTSTFAERLHHPTWIRRTWKRCEKQWIKQSTASWRRI
jgi:hypothetical protein